MPEEIAVTRHDRAEWWEQSIYQTTDLYGVNDRTPERIVARQLSHALDQLGINHRIHYGFPPRDSEKFDKRSTCGEHDGKRSGYYRWRRWIDQEKIPFVARDSNMLIMETGSGGCGALGGNVCTTPGKYISRDPGEPITAEDSRWAMNISACLHEVGHNMGFEHDPHPGYGYNDDTLGKWFRTPNQNANPVTNLCGEQIERRQYNQIVSVLEYNDCVANHISITNKESIGIGGGGGGGDDGSNDDPVDDENPADPELGGMGTVVLLGVGLAALRGLD